MRLTTTAALAGIGLMMATMAPSSAAADAKIYPYNGTNFCPAGYQPVTLGGVICCGKPNQNMSYQQVMAHPTKRRVVKKRRVVYSAKAHCPVGTKGCSYD